MNTIQIPTSTIVITDSSNRTLTLNYNMFSRYHDLYEQIINHGWAPGGDILYKGSKVDLNDLVNDKGPIFYIYPKGAMNVEPIPTKSASEFPKITINRRQPSVIQNVRRTIYEQSPIMI